MKRFERTHGHDTAQEDRFFTLLAQVKTSHWIYLRHIVGGNGDYGKTIDSNQSGAVAACRPVGLCTRQSGDICLYNIGSMCSLSRCNNPLLMWCVNSDQLFCENEHDLTIVNGRIII